MPERVASRDESHSVLGFEVLKNPKKIEPKKVFPVCFGFAKVFRVTVWKVKEQTYCFFYEVSAEMIMYISGEQ